MSSTPNGEVLVSQPGTGEVLLVRRKTDGTSEVVVFIDGLRRPHDIVFAELAGAMWVFIAETHRVVRYPYAKGDTRARPGQVVVDGLPDASTPELHGSYSHALKNIAVHDGALCMSIASTCNACVEDAVSDPQRAAIYSYDDGYNSGRGP